MKYSQQIGAAATVLLFLCCFLPWVFIEGNVHATISGFETLGTSFGKPGLMHTFFGVIMLVLFFTPKVWAKRTNVFVGALNMAWAFKNYIVYTTCAMGECPEKRFGLFAIVSLAFLMQLMAFFPKIAITETK